MYSREERSRTKLWNANFCAVYLSCLSTQIEKKKLVLKVSDLWNMSKGKGMKKKKLKSQLNYHHDSFFHCAYFCYFLQKKKEKTLS